MANYWQDRFVQLEKAQMNKGIEYYHELEKQYSKAAEEVQKEIMKWYGRLAKNNEISVSDARKLLTKDELQEFKWSVETYIQKGRENDIDGRWMKELENASAKVHINRLEAMKLQMQQQVEMLYGNEIDSFDKHIRDTYTEGFYRTAYEIQKGLGVGTNLAKLDTEKINKIIAKPWTADGSNFSSRIWKQKNQLVNELHNGLSQAFIRGTEPYDLTKQISERFKVSKGQAGRLVMTETAYFHSVAQIDAFKELGVKEYEITAVLDSRTSELCRDMDGKHLPVSEFKAGITAPPFHCWCRSTTVPYFNDEFTEEETRIARGEDDKLYEVPYNMTYRQWEKAFVEGGSKENLQPIISNPVNKQGVEIEFDFKGNDEKFAKSKEIIEQLSSEYETRLQKVTVGAEKAAGDVDMSGATLRLSSNDEHTTIHEFAHTLANSLADKYGITNDGDFWKEIRKIRNAYHRDVDKLGDTSRWISSYEHSHKMVDEFFTEAFTQAKMHEMGLELPKKYGSDLTYSNQVLDVVNKYFKKDASQIADDIEDAFEQEIKITKKPKERINGYSVNRKHVNSKKYHDKFDKIDMNKPTSEKAYTYSKELLEKADGTNLEYTTVFDARTGDEVLSTKNIDNAIANKVSLTEEQYNEVISYEGKVILMHNHPSSGRPSGTDIITTYKVPNAVGSIVVGHDGTIYFISNIKKNTNIDKLYAEYYDNHIREALNLPFDAEIPEQIDKPIIDKCKIKATTDLYDANKKHQYFKIVRI